MKVFSVLDVKSGIFSHPFFQANSNVAVRAFGDAVADSSTGINKHPEDYRLFCLGSFDDNAGTFENLKVAPEFIANATDFITPPKPIKEVVDNGSQTNSN